MSPFSLWRQITTHWGVYRNHETKNRSKHVGFEKKACYQSMTNIPLLPSMHHQRRLKRSTWGMSWKNRPRWYLRRSSALRCFLLSIWVCPKMGNAPQLSFVSGNMMMNIFAETYFQPQVGGLRSHQTNFWITTDCSSCHLSQVSTSFYYQVSRP